MIAKIKAQLGKLKLLLKVRAPANALLAQTKELKRGYRKVSFWISFIGTLLSTVAALQGVIPPQVAVIINASLTAIYNILRGLDKSEESGIRPVLKSTEFYSGVTSEISNAIIQMQTGGINPQWFNSIQAAIAFIMAMSQNLGAHSVPVIPAPAKPK